MPHKITITAQLIMFDEDSPSRVRVRNAGFLRPSAVMDIAQETLDSYFGYRHPFVAMLPDPELITDDMEIKIVRRRV